MNDKTILLAEDNPCSAEMFVSVLRVRGIENEVILARDGVEALDLLFGKSDRAGEDANISPGLVVLDLSMPRMGGLETLRRIRADERTRLLPVVVFSSSVAPQDVAEAYRLGANSYVDKASRSVPFLELVPLIARYWLEANEPVPVTVASREEARV